MTVPVRHIAAALLLSAWMGGALLTVVVVAPGAFAVLPSRTLAGVLVEETFPWDVPLMVTRGYPSLSYIYEAAEAIARLAPFLAEPRAFLCNSGAEAVDGAIKLARRTSGRPGIVAFRRGPHRRLTILAAAAATIGLTAGIEPVTPASPTPLAPSGLSLVGTACSTSCRPFTSPGRGMA